MYRLLVVVLAHGRETLQRDQSKFILLSRKSFAYGDPYGKRAAIQQLVRFRSFLEEFLLNYVQKCRHYRKMELCNGM